MAKGAADDKECVPIEPSPSLIVPLCNHRAMKRDAKTVDEWDFERIIPCHGVCMLF